MRTTSTTATCLCRLSAGLVYSFLKGKSRSLVHIRPCNSAHKMLPASRLEIRHASGRYACKGMSSDVESSFRRMVCTRRVSPGRATTNSSAQSRLHAFRACPQGANSCIFRLGSTARVRRCWSAWARRRTSQVSCLEQTAHQFTAPPTVARSTRGTFRVACPGPT